MVDTATAVKWVYYSNGTLHCPEDKEDVIGVSTLLAHTRTQTHVHTHTDKVNRAANDEMHTE